MTFIIARKYLVGLSNWLAGLSLSGPQSRARTRFLELAQEALDRAEKERLALLDEYGDKDEKGELVKIKDEKTGQESYHVSDEKLEEFNKEVNDIYEQNAEMTAPEISTTFVILRNIVCNTEEKIGPSIAAQYDEWCKAFEKLQLN